MQRLWWLVLIAPALFSQQPAAGPESVLKQAIVLHQSGDIDGAIRGYREYLALRPDSVEARSNLGAALARAGRFEEAIAEYNGALSRDGKNPAILMNLGLAYYKSGRVAEAAERMEQASALAGPNRQVTMLLASCYNRLGRYKQSIALLEPLEAENREDEAFNYLLGTALVRDKQTDRGAAVIDRILRRGDSAEARVLLAATKLDTNDFEGATSDLKKAIELSPKLPEVHSRYGQILLTMGDSRGAAAAFRQELELDRTEFMANLNLGVLAKQNQDYADARQYLERALLARPGDPGVRYQLATLELATGELEPARKRLEGLIQESPDFAEAHASLATVYYRLERPDDAERERTLAGKLTSDRQASQRGAKPR